MVLPHTQEFSRGTALIFWVALAAGAIASLVPATPLWQRVVTIPGAFLMVGGGFAGGWLIAHFLRLMLGWLSYSLAFKFSLVYFYGAPIGAVLGLLVAPPDPVLESEQLREMILLLPASLGVSAGIRNVLNQHFVAV